MKLDNKLQFDEKRYSKPKPNPNPLSKPCEIETMTLPSPSRPEADARTELDELLQRCHTTATSLGVAADHQAAVEPCSAVEMLSPKLSIRAKQGVDRIITGRREAIARLKQLNSKVETSEQDLRIKQTLFTERESKLEQAGDEQRRFYQELGRAAESLQTGFSDWASSLSELILASAESVAEQLSLWCESGVGDSPLIGMLRTVTEKALSLLAAERTETESRLALTREKLAELRDEIRQLDSGHIAPPPPHTRDPHARTEKAGAPLWALCKFRPGLSEASRAGVEAALEASGLLDAWLTPDGRLLKSDEHDTLLIAESSPQLPDEQNLAHVLMPVADPDDERSRAVETATVDAILRQIGFGPSAGPIRVEDTGRWQLGPLHGAWSKHSAEFIGPDAREARRKRRIAELTRLIGEASEVEDGIRHELDRLVSRLQIIETEVASAPTTTFVRDLHLKLELATSNVSAERTRLAEAEQHVVQTRQILSQMVADRDRDAADLRLKEWIDRLSDAETMLAEYRESVAALWPTLDSAAGKWKQAQDAEERAGEARRAEAQRTEGLRMLREKLAAAVAKSEALEATKGVVAADVLAQLEAARAKQRLLRGELDAAGDRRAQLSEGLDEARQDVQRFGEMLNQHQVQRASDIEALKSFIATRLLTTAHPDFREIQAGEWTPTRAVEIAREIDAKLSSVECDDDAWKRNQAEIHLHIEALKDALLPHSHSPVARNTDDGLFVVTVPFQGRDCTMEEFREALTAEIGHRQMLLSAREREVLETHLIHDVAAQLHDLLHRAETWVSEINRELLARPMSTGMRLRFTWQTIDNGPPGLVDARRRLMGAGGTWSEADREALGAFLQQRIEEVRQATEAGSWLAYLTEAFDYRKWHFFSVDRHQDGNWKRLTRRTYGTGSGGEKAVALTLPQFTAAAAFYTSADKLAPRLILLDEAFVGVDKDMRKKCMGLLQAFDLDLVMTSETEWGCYPTVPALAIYQLATMEGIDAVGVHRWVWNGRERRQEAQILPPASLPAEQHSTDRVKGNGDDHDGLFSK